LSVAVVQRLYKTSSGSSGLSRLVLHQSVTSRRRNYCVQRRSDSLEYVYPLTLSK